MVRVQDTRQSEAKSSEQTRYFLCSLPANDAAVIASAIRAHWAIENDLHWTLDVQMNEDGCRIRKDHGAQNFATLRRFAISRLKQDTSLKVGVKSKQLRASGDDDYRLKLLHFVSRSSGSRQRDVADPSARQRVGLGVSRATPVSSPTALTERRWATSAQQAQKAGRSERPPSPTR